MQTDELKPDVFGNLTGVGDTVACIVPGYSSLTLATVTKVTPKGFTVSYLRHGREATTNRPSTDVAMQTNELNTIAEPKRTTMMKIRTEHVIDVSDFDRLVKLTYGKPYSFQQQDGCKERQRVEISVPEKYPEDYENATIPEEVNHEKMGVSFDAWLSRDSTKPLEGSNYDWETSMWWERNFFPDVSMIINDLYKKGLLEAGEYVIDVDW